MQKRGAIWNRRQPHRDAPAAIRIARWLFVVLVVFVWTFGIVYTMSGMSESAFMSGKRLAFGEYTYTGPMFLMLGVILVILGLFGGLFPWKRRKRGWPVEL